MFNTHPHIISSDKSLLYFTLYFYNANSYIAHELLNLVTLLQTFRTRLFTVIISTFNTVDIYCYLFSAVTFILLSRMSYLMT